MSQKTKCNVADSRGRLSLHWVIANTLVFRGIRGVINIKTDGPTGTYRKSRQGFISTRYVADFRNLLYIHSFIRFSDREEDREHISVFAFLPIEIIYKEEALMKKSIAFLLIAFTLFSGCSFESLPESSESVSDESQVSDTSEAPLRKRDIYISTKESDLFSFPVAELNTNDPNLKTKEILKLYGIPLRTDLINDEKEFAKIRNDMWGVTEIPKSITVNWWGKEYTLPHAEMYFDDGTLIDGATADYMLKDGYSTLHIAFDLQTLTPVLFYQHIDNTEPIIKGFELSSDSESERNEQIKAILSEIYPDISIEEYEITVNSNVQNADNIIFSKYCGIVLTDKISVYADENSVPSIIRYTTKNGVNVLPDISEEDLSDKAKALLSEIYSAYVDGAEISNVTTDNTCVRSLFSYDLNEYVIEYNVKYTVDINEKSEERYVRMAIPYADKDGNPIKR